jgi:hypothetical protein
VKQKETAVVILNWNGKHWLEKFLPTVIQHSADDADIIVADNQSTDDSIAFVRKHYPEIQIIENPDNGGYSRGYNLALKTLDHTFFVLLNSDIEVSENWIPPVIEYMKGNPEMGACQPKIKAYHNRNEFEYAGAAGGYIDRYGYPFCRGRIFDECEVDLGQYEENAKVFWASGACLFVRRDVFFEAGQLDEHLFSHMEEIDLCWRMHHLGYDVGYCAQSEVFHVGGGTLSSDNPRKTYYNFRNNLFMMYKNMPSKVLWYILPIRLILDGLAGVKFAMDGKWNHISAILKAHGAFYRSLGRLNRQRREISKMISRKRSYKLYQNSIALDYFLRKRKKFHQLPESQFKGFQ